MNWMFIRTIWFLNALLNRVLSMLMTTMAMAATIPMGLIASISSKMDRKTSLSQTRALVSSKAN